MTRAAMRAAALLLVATALSACHKKAALRAVHPAAVDVESTVTTINSGTVEAESQAVLSFGTVGRVAKLHVHAGDAVKEGAVLAEQENGDVKAIYADAQKELDRAKKLFAEKLVSRAGFDEGRKAFEVARANYDRSVIVAPFDGLVTEMNLRVGEQAGPQSPRVPVRIVDQKPRLVKGDIDEIDLAKVKIGQKARVRVPAARQEAFEGTVTRVVPFVDTTKEQDRTSQIELRLSEAKELVPVGASAEIEIVTGMKKGVLAVPARLVLGSGKTRHVFVVSDGKLVKRSVEIGMGNYDRIEILSGVTAQDVVAFPSDEVSLEEGLRVRAETVPWP